MKHITPRAALPAALLLALTALTTACGSSSSPGTTTPPPATTSTPAPSASSGNAAPPASTANSITIASFVFTGPLTVSAGATVSVTNTDNVDHTVTADNGSFDVTVPAGKTVTFTAPAKAGTYGYFCTIHPSMHGTLIVK